MNGSWSYNGRNAGTFTDTKKEGQGLAVEYLRNAGFKIFAEEDLDEAEKFLAEIEK